MLKKAPNNTEELAAPLAEESSGKVVKISNFEGPLDLLLKLVRKKSLDVQSLRLSELTESYLQSIRDLPSFNLGEGSEFISIASTLVFIKSQSLLPHEAEEELPEEEELRERLIEYEKISALADFLENLPRLGNAVFARPTIDAEQAQFRSSNTDGAIELGQLKARHLVKALEKLSSAPRAMTYEITYGMVDRHRLMSNLAAYIKNHKLFSAKEGLHQNSSNATEFAILFVLLLEMSRLKIILLKQIEENNITCTVLKTPNTTLIDTLGGLPQ